MKKQFALIAVVLAILVMATGANASQKSKGATKSSSKVDAQMTELSTQLNLTDDQKTKIKPMLDDESAKIHAVKKDSTLSKDDAKAKSKEVRAASNQQIRAVLTPDQQKTFDSMSKKGGGKNKKSAPAPAPNV